MHSEVARHPNVAIKWSRNRNTRQQMEIDH